ncbi:hypothetical protein J8I01_13355 [Aeromonas sanarellii]|uniref:Flagellin n=1 Tax=Aeromonas sanarellii TaxID=633415 RepID=A0ABS4B7M1_9GAMM|nr:hypothetical protein [Aeromonas sanarellii]MBP0603491.1 hypothetical protein [Aeromonas sanarellii]
MQIQQTRPGGVAETPAQPRLQGRSTAQTGSPQTPRNERQPNVIRLDRWALIGTAQQRIAHAQGSEQALSQVWGELKRLEQQLGQQKAASGDLVSRLKLLEEKLTQPQAPLTSELRPRLLASAADSRVHYGAERLDLLSPRSSAERIVFSFPQTSSAVEVLLPADASESEAASRLDRALRKEHIQARLNELGKLELSVPDQHRRKLDEPVLLSGEGIRIPAGNPVPVQFKQRAGQLTQLGEGLDRGEIKQEQQRLKRLLGEIEQSVRELKQFRQKMVKQLDRVKARSQHLQEEELTQLQGKLSLQLKEGGFMGTMSGLLAQANVSRQNVVALLA